MIVNLHASLMWHPLAHVTILDFYQFITGSINIKGYMYSMNTNIQKYFNISLYTNTAVPLTCHSCGGRNPAAPGSL